MLTKEKIKFKKLGTNSKKESLKAGDITKQILQYLTMKGYYVFRVNNIPARGRANTIHKGIPDIMGVTKTGTALGIEVKAGSDTQKIEQREFQFQWQQRGGIYILAHDLEDVIEASL